MSNEQLRGAAGLPTGSSDAPKNFPAAAAEVGYVPEIKRRAAAATSRSSARPDRMARIALTCFRQTPKLANCDPMSVLACVVQAAQLGLEPGINGRAYLIPYGTECQFVPGWKGLLELVNRTGRATAWTGAVFDGDKFDYQLGDTPFAKHYPGSEDDPEKLQYTYAIGRIRGNEWPIIEVWTNEKIVAAPEPLQQGRQAALLVRQLGDVRAEDPAAAGAQVPAGSPELEAAIALSDAGDAGISQGLTLEGVLSQPFEPPRRDVDTDSGEVSTTSGGEVTAMVAETAAPARRRTRKCRADQQGDDGRAARPGARHDAQHCRRQAAGRARRRGTREAQEAHAGVMQIPIARQVECVERELK
jgi:recombination protein RecT